MSGSRRTDCWVARVAVAEQGRLREESPKAPARDGGRSDQAARGHADGLGSGHGDVVQHPPLEVRKATWDDVDLAGAVWTIPAERMKDGLERRVPLSDRAVAVLDEARRELPHGSATVFPSPTGCVQRNRTLTTLVRELGIDAVPHGFRSSFRDWAAEHEHSQQIAKLRREQGLNAVVRSWNLVSERADPAMHGLIDELRRCGETLPEVGYPVESHDYTEAFLELAWPSQTRGVAISPADIEAAQRLGWNVRETKQALDDSAPLDTASGRSTRPNHVSYDRYYRPKAAQSGSSRWSGRGRPRSGRHKPRSSS